jgi:hypothetical protein
MNHLLVCAASFGWARDVTATSRGGLGWVKGLKGKCLKVGLRDGAEALLPVRLPIVFAGRPSVGGVGLGCRPFRIAQRPGRRAGQRLA